MELLMEDLQLTTFLILSCSLSIQIYAELNIIIFHLVEHLQRLQRLVSEGEAELGQSVVFTVHTDLHPALSLLDLLGLQLLPGQWSRCSLHCQVSPVSCQRNLLTCGGVILITDLTSAKLFLECCLGGGVQHLLSGGAGLWRPGDEDPEIEVSCIFVIQSVQYETWGVIVKMI